jgi:signal transduction histidine kinase
MTLVLLGGVAWVVMLDRRVRRQSQIIHEKVRREGVLGERDRIAREFHDTLEQELVAITIQLDAVKAQSHNSSPAGNRHLELARSMSRRSLSEARRSVWDLRSHLLETGSLDTALKEISDPLFHDTSIEVFVAPSGTPRRLPAPTEHNLLRIGQEALTNALKHSNAKKIVIGVTYDAKQVQLSIRDDGTGFDIQAAGSARGGHFGLLDMRERAEKIGGSFCVNTKRGCGAEVRVTVATVPLAPLAGRANSPGTAIVNGG